MAEFSSIEKDKYKIVGAITEEDIERINNFKKRTTLILENTVGLSSELISKIVSERIVFSIKGGLDYDVKEKYKSKKYVDRTFVSPSGLKNIIKYFEYNESLIDPNWSEIEKAMFIYNALVVDMDYAENYDNLLSPGTTERSLNGILYGKLVCAGFAQVYKEMLDRLGIKNYYQNQKDVHAFNVIEIDGKKYGVDVTWDNTAKKNNNGRCGFSRFALDPDFYTRHGHQLFQDVDISDDFENPEIKKVYDKDEEVYDLSVLDLEQLKEYYNHIAPNINNRKPFKYNLQEQPIETKNRYLPIDEIDFKLKKEANQEYPIIIIMNFLKKRNKLLVDSQLLDAFSSRKGYVLDIGSSNGEYQYGNSDLSVAGIDNYSINMDGNLQFNDGTTRKMNCITGIYNNSSSISQEELDNVCASLNQYLNTYFKNYVSSILNNVDNLLKNYEYKPEEFDSDRFVENANIYSKLAIIVKSPDFLRQLGFSKEKINNAIQKIKAKYDEIHKPYEKEINQKENDLDFLYEVFRDLDFLWQTIEYDLKREITESEFYSLCGNVDYMLELSEKYIIIAQDKKFNLSDYSISKEDFRQLLNNIIEDHKKSVSQDTNLEIS